MTKNSAAKSRPAQGRRWEVKRPYMLGKRLADDTVRRPPALTSERLPGRELAADKASGGGCTLTHEAAPRLRQPAGVAARLSRENEINVGLADSVIFGYRREPRI